jgi:hypothetical protein
MDLQLDMDMNIDIDARHGHGHRNFAEFCVPLYHDYKLGHLYDTLKFCIPMQNLKHLWKKVDFPTCKKIPFAVHGHPTADMRNELFNHFFCS